jgi:hypothetical protein
MIECEHSYTLRPIVADLDTYWLQGGEECSKCHAKRISFDEASKLLQVAYARGKQSSETSFLAYGKGIGKIVELYGKEHVQKLLDECK